MFIVYSVEQIIRLCREGLTANLRLFTSVRYGLGRFRKITRRTEYNAGCKWHLRQRLMDSVICIYCSYGDCFVKTERESAGQYKSVYVLVVFHWKVTWRQQEFVLWDN